jgi:hypothetical protein
MLPTPRLQLSTTSSCDTSRKWLTGWTSMSASSVLRPPSSWPSRGAKTTLERASQALCAVWGCLLLHERRLMYRNPTVRPVHLTQSVRCCCEWPLLTLDQVCGPASASSSDSTSGFAFWRTSQCLGFWAWIWRRKLCWKRSCESPEFVVHAMAFSGVWIWRGCGPKLGPFVLYLTFLTKCVSAWTLIYIGPIFLPSAAHGWHHHSAAARGSTTRSTSRSTAPALTYLA